jgi:hypothetical protein
MHRSTRTEGRDDPRSPKPRSKQSWSLLDNAQAEIGPHFSVTLAALSHRETRE